MILEEIKYLSFVSILVYVILLLKDELHMMQLNSYFNRRYTKWLKENFSSRYNIEKLVVFVTASLICFVPYYPLDIALIVFSILSSFKLVKRKPKKKLDFTPRATRLFAVEITLVIVLIATIIFITNSIRYSVLFLAVIVVLSFFIILAANILASPWEILINRWYINDAKKKIESYNNLIKIGVTGSFGKTSVKHFLFDILSEKYNVLMTPGSFNTTLGVVRTIREQLHPNNEVFIIEMGAKRIGDVSEICDFVKPKYTILTAIGPQHLESFGTLENVIRAKFEIISCLPINGIGYVNFDNATIDDIPKNTKGKVVSFGVHSNADYTAGNITYKGIGMSFDVQYKEEKVLSIETRLLGEHNITNLLACCALALELKVEKYQIEKAIKSIEAVNHRLEVKKLPNGITVIDDAYNSNPVGSKMALQALKRFEGVRKFIVTPGMIELGAMEYELNYEFGRTISENCDFVFLVGPIRTTPIQDGIRSMHFPAENLFVCKNLNEATEKVRIMMKTGDVILYENDLPDNFNE